MHFQKIQEFFESRRERRQALVLATVVETRGSTYSKAGERMLIDENGLFQGMLSGGCLEGDLAIRAQQVLASGAPQTVEYDLAEDDELWGLGVGCDGAMRVFLQPVRPQQDYEPFVQIARQCTASATGAAGLVIESTIQHVAAGAALFLCEGDVTAIGVDGDTAAAMRQRCEEMRVAGAARIEAHRTADGEIQVFYAGVEPVPRLLVLGAGLDAEPLVSMTALLGWRCTLADHRPAYIENNQFQRAEQTLTCPADQLADTVDLDIFDLAVVMSHHLVSDRHYLRQLADCRIPYIGLLGPPGRRHRLMSELAEVAHKLDGRLHGPAGLDLGGRGPASVALSIVAEMQQVLALASSPAS